MHNFIIVVCHLEYADWTAFLKWGLWSILVACICTTYFKASLLMHMKFDYDFTHSHVKVLTAVWKQGDIFFFAYFVIFFNLFSCGFFFFIFFFSHYSKQEFQEFCRGKTNLMPITQVISLNFHGSSTKWHKLWKKAVMFAALHFHIQRIIGKIKPQTTY